MFIILVSLVLLSLLKKVVRKFASPWHLFMLYRNGGKKKPHNNRTVFFTTSM